MIIVLKRFVMGDGDIIAKVYGKGGMMSLYLKDAYEIDNPFFGIFEPFNVMELSYRQSGNLIIPVDYRRLERYSYLAREYLMFEWMSSIALFMLRHIGFFDVGIMELLLNYIKDRDKAKRMYAYYLKFILQVSDIIGILPRFIREDGYGFISLRDGSVSEKGDIRISEKCLSVLRKLYHGRHAGRIRLDINTFNEAKSLMDRYFEYHLQ